MLFHASKLQLALLQLAEAENILSRSTMTIYTAVQRETRPPGLWKEQGRVCLANDNGTVWFVTVHEKMRVTKL